MEEIWFMGSAWGWVDGIGMESFHLFIFSFILNFLVFLGFIFTFYQRNSIEFYP